MKLEQAESDIKSTLETMMSVMRNGRMGNETVGSGKARVVKTCSGAALGLKGTKRSDGLERKEMEEK